jgi:hypothetical protein
MKIFTVIIRDDDPMIHAGDSPSYRSITLRLTDDQLDTLKLKSNEQISKCFIEDK